MIDSERLYRDAQSDIARSFGKPPPSHDTLRKMMGQKPMDSIGILINDLELPAAPEEILARRDRLMEEKLRSDLKPMPGLPEIIKNLGGHLPLAVATGSNRRFLNLVMERLDLGKSFRVLKCEDDVHKGKPDPEIYLRTAQALDTAPEDCVVLEDSENGARAAHAAGCMTIAIPSEYTREQDFSMAHACLDNLFEASARIDSMLED